MGRGNEKSVKPSGSSESVPENTGFNFFNCWKKPPPKKDADEKVNNHPKNDTKSSKPEDNDPKQTNQADKSTSVDKPGRKDSGVQADESQGKGEPEKGKDVSGKAKHQPKKNQKPPVNGKSDKEDRPKRCPKCYKRKKEGHRNDRRYCKCRNRGSCNTNTIIFPNDFKQAPVAQQEIGYLEIIKEIIRNESKHNCFDTSDLRRELERQREEIRELKSLLLQSLINRNFVDSTKPANDQKQNEPKAEENKKSKENPRKKHRKRPGSEDSSDHAPSGRTTKPNLTSESMSVLTSENPLPKDQEVREKPSKNEPTDPGQEEKPKTGLWGKFFGKKN